ncbi:Putative Transcriptional regulator [Paraburkholderia unamae]|nr:Putative Transcriptional regulator [Paraburkholderia unamae]
MPEERPRAPAVDQAMEILETIVQSTWPLTLSEIAERVGIPVASCHRLLTTLLHRDLIVRDLQRKKAYCAGPKLFLWASAVYLQQPVVAAFHSIADVLKNELHQAVNLSVMAGAHTLVVAHVSWPLSETFGGHVGTSDVLHDAAAGRAMMSMLSETVQKNYWTEFLADPQGKRTARAASEHAWMKELAEIRRVGYALMPSGTRPHVSTLAAPVLNRRGEPLAAIGVCFPAQQDIRHYVTPLIQATRQLSSRLG